VQRPWRIGRVNLQKDPSDKIFAKEPKLHAWKAESR